MKKIYNCIDCGKDVSDYRVTRCRKCADKQHGLNMMNENNPAYKGIIYKCIDCNKLITWRAKRCQECYHIYIKKFGIMKNRQKSKIWRDRIKKTMLNNGTTKGKNNPMFGKVTHGRWGIYKGIKMRSSYELTFAQFLDLSNIKYLYESKTFDLGNTTYTPDFYLPEHNLYIEIKGWWREDAQRKFKKFLKQYPNINLQILMQKDLQILGVL